MNGVAPNAGAMMEFLSTAARVLHAHGAPVHEVEESVVACGEALGLDVQVFAAPTYIDIAIGGSRQHGHLIRAGAGDADLGRLVIIDRILSAVRRGELGPAEGCEQLRRVSEQRPAWGPGMLVAAFGLTSGGAAYFFGGNLADLLASTMVGAFLGLLSVLASSRPSLGQLYNPVSAFAATLASVALATMIPGIQPQVVAIAGLVVLLPGLSLTLALSELATKHLVSGTSRLAGSLTVFATMAVGVGLARALAEGLGLGGPVEAELSEAGIWLGSLPEWARWTALIISPIGWALCSQTRAADLPFITVVGILANEVCRIGGETFGAEIGAFASALVVGVGANGYARRRHVPRDVVLQPCLLLLVPGSAGFRGVTAFVAQDMSGGLQTLVGMALIASTLVAGVLAANMVVSPSRAAENTLAKRALASQTCPGTAH